MRCSPVAFPFILAALAACAADPSGSAAVRGLPLDNVSSSDLAVTSAIADADTAVAPALQVRSDGLGAYQNAKTLTSVIQGIGAWVLDSYNPRGATRRVTLDFSQPIAGSAPGGGDPPAMPSGSYLARTIAKCNLYNTPMQGILPGTSTPCPLHLAFDVGSTKYALQMNPFPSSGDPEGAAETSYATVACTAPAGGAGPCTAWRLTPSGTFTAGDGNTRYRNVARLIKYVISHGTPTPVSQGDFYLSFSITVTNP